ncbi:hypothetical protein BDV11DRAFT_193905 [Aspergillus similis]
MLKPPLCDLSTPSLRTLPLRLPGTQQKLRMYRQLTDIRLCRRQALTRFSVYLKSSALPKRRTPSGKDALAEGT